MNKLLAKAKKAARKIMRKLGIGSKEKPKNKEQHDQQVKAGMQYLHQQEKALNSDSDKAITPEEANKVAAKTKKKFKVFDSITPRKNGNKWVFDWKGSSGTETGVNVDNEVEADGTPKSILKKHQNEVHKDALATVQKTVDKIGLDKKFETGPDHFLFKKIINTLVINDLAFVSNIFWL